MAGWTVLVIGSGGREHALASRLLDCDSVGRVLVSPGNGGTQSEASRGRLESVQGDPLDVARATRPDLIVVGPEQPLCDGLSDVLSSEGFAVYGPSRAAARLEGSKAFMKEFALRHGVRTAQHVSVNDGRELERALASFAAPPVVKATGLCAGKGVVVAESFEEAHTAARGMLDGSAFGEAGKTVVLEERLYGQEVSVHAVCDGERAWILPGIQDHKRIFDGDRGPNTGGMGTYGPAPVLTSQLRDVVERDTIVPLVQGMAREGSPFRGTLFANMMVSDRGDALLLEVNVRFGDPETQVLMNLIDGDLARLLHSAAIGKLDETVATVSARHALCVVLASRGYPATVQKGDPISGIELAEQVEGVRVYHAGTTRRGNELLTSGGRVLGVTATDVTLLDAHRRAYEACQRIHFEGMQYRRDIAHLGLRAPAA